MTQKLINVIKLIRLDHYIKNLLVFFPIFFGGKLTNWECLTSTLIAFIAFSLFSSSVYILNDYLDIEYDRKHPTKKLRPIAANLITKREALFLMLVFFTAGLLIMLTQSIEALAIMICYFILNIAYSLRLKRAAIVDINIIAIGFVLRLFVGSFVSDIILSKWLILMTFLMALFLALAKRRDDVLHFNNTGNKTREAINGYNLQLIDGATLIMASVLIVTYILYTFSFEVVDRVNSEYLYLTTLFVILGLLRYLQIIYVDNKSGSPTQIIFSDKFIILSLISWLLSFVFILY